MGKSKGRVLSTLKLDKQFKVPDDVLNAVEGENAAVTTKKKKAAPVPLSERENVDKPVKPAENGAAPDADTPVEGKALKRKKKAVKDGTAPADDAPAVEEKGLKRKKKAGKDGMAHEEDIPAVQNKAVKRKKNVDNNGHAAEADDGEAVPPKKVKEDSRVIKAGTTIDQVPGIKLKKKKSKREKHAKFVNDRKEKAKNKERDEALRYLDVWKNNRANWRFEKLKQIYIQTHVFAEDKINADIFPLALEYLSGMQGSGKESLKKTAEAIIKQIDASVAENGDDSAQESSKYQRARELLQSLG